MADLYPAEPEEASSDANPPTPADLKAEKATLFGTLAHLWPYIWPGDRADLKMRVVWSMVLLLVAKVATLFVPFTFKWAVDALTGADFAKVAMHAVRKLAFLTFVHMHELSLRFHLERKTGGLTRVLERGRNGIETIVRMVILQLAPTIVEFGLMMAVSCSGSLTGAMCGDVLVTVVIYMAGSPTGDRMAHQYPPEMNDSDTDANTKAIDSLLNFETVKYFGAEERESARLRPLHGALREGQRQDLYLARGAQRRAGGHLHASASPS
jgi:ABC-type multidrug transport system fused ATPase/permease subunit